MIIPRLLTEDYARLFSYLRKTLAAGEIQFDCHPAVLVDMVAKRRRVVPVVEASWSMLFGFWSERETMMKVAQNNQGKIH